MALNKQLRKADQSTREAITRARNGGEASSHILEELEMALPHLEIAFRYATEAEDSE